MWRGQDVAGLTVYDNTRPHTALRYLFRRAKEAAERAFEKTGEGAAITAGIFNMGFNAQRHHRRSSRFGNTYE
ncbi:MAG: hypothetical protein VYA69_00800 [Gemmatimonadota bacterium]|nr:hypothetical protein [Gemmatimonadota bacterium]